MLLASFAAVVAVLIYLPSFWVRRVMRLYGGDSVDIPGTGAELARHLIDRFQLDGVAVEGGGGDQGGAALVAGRAA